MRCKLVLSLTLFFISITGFAQLKLPAIFSDHMVLQRESNVPVWGWPKPGESIQVSTNWSKEKVTVLTNENGIWDAKISTGKAGGPFVLTIKSANETLRVADVLLGEVWVCSGQSNMGFALINELNGKAEAANANHPNIRHYEEKRQVSDIPLTDSPGSEWAAVSPGNAGKFAAVAYYFAVKLQAELNVPVGLIEVAWGGTAADNWTPREVLQNDPKLSVALDRYNEWQTDFKIDSVGYYAQLISVLVSFSQDTTGTHKIMQSISDPEWQCQPISHQG